MKSHTSVTPRSSSSSAAHDLSPIPTSTRSSGAFCRACRAPGIALEELPTLDAILLTHAHADHLSFDSLDRLPRSHSAVRAAGRSRIGCAGSATRHAVDLAPGESVRIGDADDSRRGAPRTAAIATATTAGEARRTCICSTPARRRSSPATRRSSTTRTIWWSASVGERTRARPRAASDWIRAVVEARISQRPSDARRRARRSSSGFARACSCPITGVRSGTSPRRRTTPSVDLRERVDAQHLQRGRSHHRAGRIARSRETTRSDWRMSRTTPRRAVTDSSARSLGDDRRARRRAPDAARCRDRAALRAERARRSRAPRSIGGRRGAHGRAYRTSRRRRQRRRSVGRHSLRRAGVVHWRRLRSRSSRTADSSCRRRSSRRSSRAARDWRCPANSRAARCSTASSTFSRQRRRAISSTRVARRSGRRAASARRRTESARSRLARRAHRTGSAHRVRHRLSRGGRRPDCAGAHPRGGASESSSALEQLLATARDGRARARGRAGRARGSAERRQVVAVQRAGRRERARS